MLAITVETLPPDRAFWMRNILQFLPFALGAVLLWAASGSLRASVILVVVLTIVAMSLRLLQARYARRALENPRFAIRASLGRTVGMLKASSSGLLWTSHKRAEHAERVAVDWENVRSVTVQGLTAIVSESRLRIETDSEMVLELVIGSNPGRLALALERAISLT